MINLERICREAGGTLTRLATGHGQSGEAWVFHVTDYYEQPTYSISRLCNAVLEEAAKVCDTAAELPWDETSDRPSVNAGDCAALIRTLRVPENSRDENRGCGKPLAEGQFWNFCGETDMGQTAPALCMECGGTYVLRSPASNAQP